MYMLNFLFDFNQDRGHFSGDRNVATGQELLLSKNWLKLSGAEPPNPVNFNPDVRGWTDLGDVETQALLVPFNDPQGVDDSNISVRIAPDPTSTFNLVLGPNGAELTLVVCFGRPTMARHPLASPFLVNGQVETTFVFADRKTNTTTAAGQPAGWYFHLGIIERSGRPNNPHRAFPYQFSVGIKVRDVGGAGPVVTRHYGQDPEMDIGD